jgi:F-type H+-transporting ATPase subunit b
MQTLDVISINLWQILASLLNLTILFLLIKKFLYNPVKKMLEARQNTIDGEYSAAEKAKEEALSDKRAYEEKLSGAKAEAESVIQSAVSIARSRENEILAEAKDRADGILRKAEEDAALELRKAEADIKKEIVDVSALLTEKMLQREINSADHKNLIDSSIEGIGDER